jgi:hypothetical protein
LEQRIVADPSAERILSFSGALERGSFVTSGPGGAEADDDEASGLMYE